MNKLNISALAESDRPREKLLAQGRRALTEAELLAILIGSGSTEENAVLLCQRMLADVKNDLNLLSKLEVKELSRYHGIGSAKALCIIAALELGRRRNRNGQESKNPLLNSSKRVYDYFKAQMQDLPHEEFWVLYMNTACKVVDQQLISRGGINFTPVDIRVIFRYALQAKAHSMILIHNHPSGSTKASDADILLTSKIVEGASLLDIKVNDHVIFTDRSYYSFRDDGLL